MFEKGYLMIYREPFPFKNFGLWFLTICIGLVSVYIIFIALISIYVGANHLQHDGFWMPISAGLISIMAVLWLFYSFIRFVLNQMKEKDIVEI